MVWGTPANDNVVRITKVAVQKMMDFIIASGLV
jgi:hypothetical protein